MLASAAETAPRVRNAALGFSGQFRNRHWAPLVVDVENPGPARTGLLVVETQGHVSQQTVVFSRPVFLPANAYRRFEFPLRPDAKPRINPGKVQFEKVAQVRLTDGAFQEWSKTDVVGSIVAEDTFFTLVVDTRFLGYHPLREGTVGPEKRPLARATLPVRNFPRRPIDLSGFDAVVIGDMGETDFSPLQVRALREWVRLGGQLFVLPSIMPALSPALAELLPTGFFSTNVVETLPAIAPGFVFSNGVTFARMVVREGTGAVVEAGARERPLIVSRREGTGRVTALAFDAGQESFAVWPGAGRFWCERFAAVPQFFHHADRLLARAPAVERILSSLAGMKVLGRGALVVYLGVALLVLLGTIAAFRFTRVPEWGWPVAVVLALAGGGGAIVGAAAWKAQPQPFLNEVFVATAESGAESARVQAALGLFAPKETKFSVRLPADTVSLAPAKSLLSPPEQLRFSFEETLAVTNLAVRADDLRVVFGRAPVVETPMPTVVVRVGAEGLAVVVTNRTTTRLAGAFLKFNRLLVPLGDIAKGARSERAGIQKNAGETATELVRSAQQVQRDQLREVFFPEPVYVGDRTWMADDRRFQKMMRGREPLPVLFSWSDQPTFPIAQIEPPVARRALGLWAVAATVEYAGGRVFFPAGALPLRVRNQGALPFERGEGCFASARPGLIVVEFSLPPGCPPVQADEATVTMGFRGTAFLPEVFVGDGELEVGEETERALTRWTKVAGTGGGWRMADVARVWGASSRKLLVAVRIAHTEEGRRLTSNSTANFHLWQVRDLDLELKGTVR